MPNGYAMKYLMPAPTADPCQWLRVRLLMGVISMGKFLMFAGVVAGGIVWLYTSFVFFATGQTLLGLISLLIPPADLVLPFLISVPLGLIGLGCTALMFIGAAIDKD